MNVKLERVDFASDGIVMSGGSVLELVSVHVSSELVFTLQESELVIVSSVFEDRETGALFLYCTRSRLSVQESTFNNNVGGGVYVNLNLFRPTANCLLT